MPNEKLVVRQDGFKVAIEISSATRPAVARITLSPEDAIALGHQLLIAAEEAQAEEADAKMRDEQDAGLRDRNGDVIPDARYP